MLAVLIKRVKDEGQIFGIVPHLTQSFLWITPRQSSKHEAPVCAFEQVSGLKINFNKSELFCF
jgi:hypothetical protein